MRVIFTSVIYCYSSWARFHFAAFDGDETWFDSYDLDEWPTAGVIDGESSYYWNDRII